MRYLHEEGKTMGLAAYGEPSRFLDFFRHHAYLREDGRYYINPLFIESIFGHTLGPQLYDWGEPTTEAKLLWEELMELRHTPIPYSTKSITQDDMDIAYAGQVILEEIILGLAQYAIKLTGARNLCITGGVALNSVANGKLLTSGCCENLYIPPAPGDEGQALGKLLNHIRTSGISVDTSITTAYMGPLYSQYEICSTIKQHSNTIEVIYEGDDIINYTANLILKGKVVGWYQGRSELGPRALGHRSILADPRRFNMREHINVNVKNREWYRPLAPVVLEESIYHYFHIDRPSSFMEFAVSVRKEKQAFIPAVTHVDGTARLQTINRTQDARFYDLVEKFGHLSGIPILLNTSFNRRNEPIVETPNDAINAFVDMNLDTLILGEIVIIKK
jgi:carbamoyltransferase